MPFIVAIDYDGTLVEDTFPEIGPFREKVLSKAIELKEAGAEIILWTCREGRSLSEAVGRCYEAGLQFDAINENAPVEIQFIEKIKKENGDTMAQHKVYADIYVDDKAPGSIDYFLKIDVQKTIANFANRSR